MPDIMSVKERINLFIEYKNISVKQFEEICSLSNGYISSMRKSFGTEKLDNVLHAYPDLNREWLLYGEGEMLRSEQKTENFSENNSGVSNVSGNGNRIKNEVPSSSTDKNVEMILKEMAEQRKDYIAQINVLLDHINDLTKKLVDK